MTNEEFKKIFNRFAFIWNGRWNNQFEKNPEGITTEWWDALKKFKFHDVESAVFKARNAFEWPPTIAAFLNLIPKDKSDIPIWTHAHSAEITDKIIRRIVPKNFTEHCLLTQEIFPELEKRIFDLRSDKVDFSICVIADCKSFHIHDFPRPLVWYCNSHTGITHESYNPNSLDTQN